MDFFVALQRRLTNTDMFVVHPKDKTTSMLSILYEGLEARVVSEDCSAKAMERLLHHTSCQERILLLGHGSDKGLFYRKDDESEGFDRLIISHSHAFHLRKHGGNMVAVWCHADLFARSEGLHGLFSGMIVSEMSEALMYGIETTEDELKIETIKLARRLRSLLDEGTLLSDIPQRMLTLDDVHTPLTEFNYRNFFYL